MSVTPYKKLKHAKSAIDTIIGHAKENVAEKE
jgi:hypothetical protein